MTDRNSAQRRETGRSLELEPDDNPLRRTRRRNGLRDLGSATGADQIAFETVARPAQESHPTPEKLLLCFDCAVVYDDDGAWEYCPRCGEDLEEVEKV